MPFFLEEVFLDTLTPGGGSLRDPKTLFRGEKMEVHQIAGKLISFVNAGGDPRVALHNIVITRPKRHSYGAP